MTPFVKKFAPILIAFLLLSCGGNEEAAQLASQTRGGEGIAQNLYNQGVADQQAGRTKQARKAFRTINSAYPQSAVAADASYRYAQLLEREGDLLDAFDAYHDVVSKYPASPHYATAMKRQETIAHQAAQGHITNSFIGIKSRIDVDKTTEMLGKVRDNAPRAASADRAQFTIGQVLQTRGSDTKQSADRAIAAYQQVVRDYPNSSYAPEAQFQIGNILLTQARQGNQDAANLDRAKKAFDDLILRYPNSKRASDARRQISQLASGDIQRSFEVAEFYRKKGQNSSALFYYREVAKNSQPGPLRSQAEAWIQKLSKP